MVLALFKKTGLFSRLLSVALMFFTVFGTTVVEAKRLGGGGSYGMQRQVTPQRQATPPSYQRPAPGQPPQAAPSGWRKWAGPLAGLAAGIGLAALMSHFGMGGDFAGIFLLIVGAVVVFALVRRFMAPRMPQPAGGPAWQDGPAHFEAQQPVGGPAPDAVHIPADFDVAGFTRQAKVSFIRLQAANDSANLEDIREFTTPEMFAELKLDIDARHGAVQKTDVVSVEANVIEVQEESARYVVTVRFYGLVREEANASPVPFDEMWHLTKPRDNSRGWALAGIQQLN